MTHWILLVEDDAFSRELLCDWLETEGCGVTTATDLEGARAAIAQQPPDAILLDVQLGA